ncbi:WGR domain-containing protein [Rhizobium sp. AQ_MP]|uniref:WGR domain-containing protein n=1 Tax=Rhizobium sp. AQ_MP TaxID=2761536 RepID=UPI00163AA940|nr:WGR domain-containing protein [Rhizobium sp. AQ_MP]MBC2775812.1 WGR domain-containing protein [Rhizobium sp. AQ_MP]
MIKQPYHLYMERIDAARNMARYYALEISMDLLGHVLLNRTWGRIGRRGPSMKHVFENEADAVKLFLDLLRQKRSKGYQPAIQEPSGTGASLKHPCRTMQAAGEQSSRKTAPAMETLTATGNDPNHPSQSSVVTWMSQLIGVENPKQVKRQTAV